MSAAIAPPGSASSPFHIPSLDGLRAISFFLVFIAHMGFEQVVPGGFGVTIFFFLSGYLITTLMRAEYERNGSVNLRHFWLRRVWRILPPFYLVLLSATALSLLLFPPGTLNFNALLAQLFHFTNYWVIAHGHPGEPLGTGVYWSLAVEEHFYLLFPWLYLGMQRIGLSRQRQALVLYSLCALALAWRFVLVTVFNVHTDRTYMASDTRLDSILFGCALAVWRNPVLDAPEVGATVRRFLVFPVSLAILAGCLLVRDQVFRETLRYSLQGIALTGIFIVAIRDWNALPFRWLNLPLLRFFGTLSYSLYLLHLTVLFLFARYLPDLNVLVRGAAALAVATAFAWLIYVFVEKPCARLRKRLTH